MSGHSHYATIKRQKESKDAQKGQIFSKMARAISIAVKTGGGPDPLANYKLRMAMDTARSYNMPKDNIERAISKASSEAENIEEVNYEGFGPSGISVIVETLTDNRNRTGQEIKNIFERGGGRLAGPGSVFYNFDQKGLIIVKKKDNFDEQVLKLIDAGAEEVEETDDGIEVYTLPDKLSEVRNNIEKLGYEVDSSQLFMKAKNLQTIDNEQEALKAIQFLDKLDELDDVQKVHSNLDIPEIVLNKISK